MHLQTLVCWLGMQLHKYRSLDCDHCNWEPHMVLMLQEVRGMDGLKEATINIKPADDSPYKKYDPEGKVSKRSRKGRAVKRLKLWKG